MRKGEIPKLQAFLRAALSAMTTCASSPTRRIPRTPPPCIWASARIATITVDDEDGDRSVAFENEDPCRPRRRCRNTCASCSRTTSSRSPRGKKLDLAELNSGEDFLGVISADDAKLPVSRCR